MTPKLKPLSKGIVMSTYTTRNEILKSLMPNQELVELDNDDVLLVKRTTKGNMLPAYSQQMTVGDAKKYGAWDLCNGTMEFFVCMHPDVYEDALTVQNHNGFVFAIRNHPEL